MTSVEGAKIRSLVLERNVHDQADRAVWVDSVRSMHRLFNAKKAAHTASIISAESGDPKRLWRVLNATMGLSEPDPDIPHSAVEFASFFADKV